MSSIRQVTWTNELGTWGLSAENDTLLSILPPNHRDLDLAAAEGNQVDSFFRTVIDQLESYFAGELQSFELPYKMRGTPFQVSVWEQLLLIPYGETRTYGELARQIGNPAASRAVGAANGRNPLSIIVPCHRVIGAGGTLTGYAGGLECKNFLLQLESAVSSRSRSRQAELV
jgi:methylated-DNA-[protein]-cysteine S-methyltransferase